MNLYAVLGWIIALAGSAYRRSGYGTLATLVSICLILYGAHILDTPTERTP